MREYIQEFLVIVGFLAALFLLTIVLMSLSTQYSDATLYVTQ